MSDSNRYSDWWTDDQAVWNAFQNGDRKAFEHIYKKYSKTLVVYGIRIAEEKQIVQDCIQDLFIELWDGRERLSNVDSLKFYLLKSLRYKIIRHFKSRQLDDLNDPDNYVDGENFEVLKVREENILYQSRKLSAAIALLPKRQREAIHLRYLQEMSNEEVARIMGVNYQSACKFIYTALKSLKEVMLVFISICF